LTTLFGPLAAPVAPTPKPAPPRAPKTHPILFNAAMVLAVLRGEKTQTRRPPSHPLAPLAGDTLWVRETWMASGPGCTCRDPECEVSAVAIRYEADGATTLCEPDEGATGIRKEWVAEVGERWTWDTTWRPSIHMPRWASRLNLRVVNVVTQPLEDINEADALAEGFRDRAAFLRAYREIYPGEYNPTVRVIIFEVIR
jgi:hypothetical protein